jgi:F-type H+-transporting ATPase subunit delta
MAELSTIARPYAQALFDAAGAAGAGTAGQWIPALDAIAAFLAQTSVASSISNPGLSDAQRFDLIVSLAGQSVPAPVQELLKLVLQNERLAAFGAIVQQFHQLKNASEGAADCVVETAFALSEHDTRDLVAALTAKFSLTLKPEVRVNPALIGGVRITVGDRVLDSSVLARLDAMRARLTA